MECKLELIEEYTYTDSIRARYNVIDHLGHTVATAIKTAEDNNFFHVDMLTNNPITQKYVLKALGVLDDETSN